jgi:arginyl-tRNA synthetase
MDQFGNVLDEVLDVLERHDLSDSTRLSVPHHPGRRDLSLFGLPAAESDRADRAVSEIRSLPAIGGASVGRSGRAGFRLSDQRVEEIGELLESGVGDVLDTRGVYPEKQLVVDFCDPNASKALHVGHLRNLALGNAVASITRACGISTTTTSQVGDVGRSMAEAIAGYLRYADGENPDTRDEKSDHFIGSCYSRYVQEEGGADLGDPALSREDLEHEDFAESVHTELTRQNPEVLSLWQDVRRWALEGHEATLGRLGVKFDRQFLESDYLAEIESIGDRLIEMRLVEIAPNGVAFHDTQDSNYPHLVLRRSDGFSTQHLRYIALWYATRPAIGDADSLQVMGDEWLHIGAYGDSLMKELAGGGVVHPANQLLHGMVDVEGRVVKSSGAAPWLVDDLLDELTGSAEIERLAGGDAEMADRLAATAALGFFLGHPPAKPISLSLAALLDPTANAAWAMALAAFKAWDEQYDGPPDPAPKDRDYRFLVAQSQVHRQLARRVCDEFNPLHLSRFHMHLARWFLETPCTPRLARAMRVVSSAGLSALGLRMRLTGLEPVSAA